MKVLGPYPVLQFIFGLAVLGFGIYLIIRGTQKKDEPVASIEDKREEWRAYDRLKNIEENSFKQVELLSKIYDRLNNNADSMKGLAAAIWNKREGI